MIRCSSLRGIADDRGAVGAARQVLEQPAALDLELDVVDRVVQLLLRDRPGAVDRVEVERRRAEVARVRRVGRRAPAATWRRRSCRGRGTGRRTSSPPCGSGCSDCSRSATGRRSAPWARPPADRAASSRPPGLPSSRRAASTFGVCCANAGNRKSRPKCSAAADPDVRARPVRGRRPRRRDRAHRVQRHSPRARPHGTQKPPAAEPMLVVRGHRCCR